MFKILATILVLILFSFSPAQAHGDELSGETSGAMLSMMNGHSPMMGWFGWGFGWALMISFLVLVVVTIIALIYWLINQGKGRK